MRETIKTRAGAVSVNTNQAGQIKLEVRTLNYTEIISQTHPLTVEQCHVLIHALSRAIELEAKGGAA